MHLVARLAPDLMTRTSDGEIARAAAALGLSVRALSSYFAGRADRQGLVLGYAGFGEDEIRRAMRTLSGLLRGAL